MKQCLILFILIGIFLLSGCARMHHDQSYQYSIVSQNSGKCLSLDPAGGYYDGDPAQQWDCAHYHMGLQKAWLFVPNGPYAYQILSIHSGKCLEVKLSPMGGKNNGDVLQQSKCTGADNQNWIVVNEILGLPTAIRSVHSGKCAEVNLGSTGGKQDGDPIDQWDCVAGDSQPPSNQLWRLNPITAPNPPLDTGKGELCNVCNPGNPECKPGALCIVMLSGQSICGQSCSTAVGCPTGYTCTKMMKLGQTYFQCVPDGNGCPF